VLVLNSARCKSAGVGLAGDLPNIDSNPATIRPRNEFNLSRIAILTARNLYIQKSEYRNSKSETNSKFEFQMPKTDGFAVILSEAKNLIIPM